MAPLVSIVKCDSYEESAVESSVSEALAHLGGIGKYVKTGNRVLLKVNLLSASTPDKAITTHPSVVKALVKQVQSAGGIPIIADSPGGPFSRGMLESAYRKSGMSSVAQETGARLNYDTSSKQVSNPEGRIAKMLDLISILDVVDVVITVPKLKTHMLTKFTGATKILFGVVPGLTKPAYHLKFADIDSFCDMLLDILVYVRPSLSVMDGVIGIEGDGPGSGGTPRKAGIILASEDSVALDVVASSIIGMTVDEVPILKRAKERGLTTGNLSDINIIGAKADDVKVKFRQPATGKGITKLLSNNGIRSLLMRFTLPYPSASSKCVRCGICKQNCPAGAITLKGKAHMNMGKCIRCYCCHELCPYKAIELKSHLGWVGRLRGKAGKKR
jgi:uncharacterized protein (DUF362 family)/NAD-dependent dihydropyrimidine dehydrogenase PreA subunit